MVLLVDSFWRIDSMTGSTVLLQHLRQIRQHHNLVQAASGFCCQLVAEACSCGKPPVISLQRLLDEASILLFPLPLGHLQVASLCT